MPRWDIPALHRLERVTAPAPLLDMEAVKQHVRAAEFDDDDALLEIYLATAMAALDGPDGLLGRAIVSQNWSFTVAGPDRDGRVFLPLTPAISLQAITYFDPAGSVITPSLTGWALDAGNDFAFVTPPDDVWPALADRWDALTVTYAAGYGTPSEVPANIRHIALLMIGHWYKNREAVTDKAMVSLPMAVETLLSLQKRGWVGA